MRDSGVAALEGVRVLDLTRYIPGPYCTMLLGDLGAEVVKVEEPPRGDPTRAATPAVGGESAVHAALNRNKRSVAVDIRNAEGVGIVRRLAARADVLIETFRPGALSGRGLGAEVLCQENPRLVYCSLTGYGGDGPLARRAGHDIDYIALGGLLGTTRDALGRPVLPTTQLADMTGGLLATIGILAALQARARTGRGQVVDVSLLEGVLSLMTVPAARLLAGGNLASELTGTHACYNVFRCRDGGYLAVGALEPKFWESLCRALGLPERIPRQWEAAGERQETIEAMARKFASRDRDDWVRELGPVEACVEPVLDLAEALEQPQARARGAVVERHSGGVALRTLDSPLRLRDTPVRVRREVPAFGEHTDAVLTEAGYGREEIAHWRAGGVIA
ncbi:MAG TPA: CaiB/BaiF CoA-transferase family protein [Vicinamibacteria bacterium]|nr:CaiB/BaiF CoA-transferase family protein [Vicinamibacteria bacterium]